MTELVFHHDHQQLPAASDNLLPVQMYGCSGRNRGDISVIGNAVIDKIKRLCMFEKIPAQAIDFLSIALAVTAADTFVCRSQSADGWARQLSIRLPLHEPDRWNQVKQKLVSALHFLSGDIWAFEFLKGGFSPPEPYSPTGRRRLINLFNLDSVCLFSGGLDSAIGAIDFIKMDRKPLLVSHAYKGDKNHQDQIAQLISGRFSRFAVNAYPGLAKFTKRKSDVTMRTRSFNFLAFGAIGACAVQSINKLDKVELFVPENGFISLNAPLTSRRIGSLSTRTTHPYFIDAIQEIFDAATIPCTIKNPYQFKTKGEMVRECKDEDVLQHVVNNTVSCSHWKRPHKQCGVCVPCIVRRAALHAGALQENTDYQFNNISDVLNDEKRRDDLFAVSIAVAQRKKRKIGPWILDSGPLPPEEYRNYQRVFIRGLEEIERFLKAEKIL
ncbi:MAG: DNA-binding protein [Candidatus Electrothrix sp. ATG2]|nr:DNA-binding protein [Candidatus Electrothrix sp. ATG2]